MGIDIHGWVEVREGKDWYAVIDAGALLDTNYDMFGMLFGVKNYTGFQPVAERRGIPEDVSWRVEKDLEEFRGWAFAQTWVTWAELKAIDWEEESPGYDGRVHIYRIQPDGTEKYIGKVLLTSDLSREDYQRLWRGEEVRKRNIIYRAEPMKRKDALGKDWKLLFKLMEVLAEHHGDENVRLVVWFV